MIDLPDIAACATLNNGVKIPRLGLGVFRTEDGRAVRNAVAWALEAGYRHIDTAKIYGNEAGVGEAVADAKAPREEVFITTKVWNEDLRQHRTREAVEASLARLGTGYVDLLLIHWPVKGVFVDAWKEMERLYAEGKARAIGVSNFLVHHLDTLLDETDVVPAVNQVEFHPLLQQPGLRAYCGDRQIAVEAWTPILRGKVNDIPELLKIAHAHGKTPVQATLRWELQEDIITIPKSARRDRIQSNADLYDFDLSEEEVETIRSLDANHRTGAHPDHVTF